MGIDQQGNGARNLEHRKVSHPIEYDCFGTERARHSLAASHGASKILTAIHDQTWSPASCGESPDIRAKGLANDVVDDLNGPVCAARDIDRSLDQAVGAVLRSKSAWDKVIEEGINTPLENGSDFSKRFVGDAQFQRATKRCRRQNSPGCQRPEKHPDRTSDRTTHQMSPLEPKMIQDRQHVGGVVHHTERAYLRRSTVAT
jgi:hypothetical protein